MLCSWVRVGVGALGAVCVAGLSVLAGGALSASAEVIAFAGYDVEIDAQAGSGANASVLVIDWDTFGGPYVSSSHAFLYRWDGDATVLDMLTAFQDGGVFTFETGFGGGFLNNISYIDGDSDSHTNPVAGNWELASGMDALGVWEGFDLSNPDWDFSVLGIDAELLADGQFEGMNAVFFDPDDNFARVGSPLTVPGVPEPETLGLLALSGGLLTIRR